MKEGNRALILGLVAVLIWSTVATAFKITLREMGPLTMLFISSFVSLIVVTIYIYTSRKGKDLFRMKKKTALKLMLTGLLNPFIYYVFLFEGYDRLPAQIAQSINYSWPIVLTILSILVLKQKIGKWSLIGIGLGFTGVIIVSTKGFTLTGNIEEPFGLLAAGASAICWAVFWTLNLKIKGDPGVKIFYNFLGGVIPISIAALVLSPPLPSIEGWGGAIYIGVFEMGLTFIIWLKALSATDDTSRISSLIYLSPFISLLLIGLILGEKILLTTLIGLMLIVIGIIIQRSKRKKREKV